jgi:hypothetical protein
MSTLKSDKNKWESFYHLLRITYWVNFSFAYIVFSTPHPCEGRKRKKWSKILIYFAFEKLWKFIHHMNINLLYCKNEIQMSSAFFWTMCLKSFHFHILLFSSHLFGKKPHEKGKFICIHY